MAEDLGRQSAVILETRSRVRDVHLGFDNRFATVARFELGEHSCFLANPVRKLEKQDRKSTRLNSSHRCNSYADFCLKKKENTGSFDCSRCVDSYILTDEYAFTDKMIRTNDRYDEFLPYGRNYSYPSF